MSTFLWLGVGWVGLAILGWSWLTAAHRADRTRAAPPPVVEPRARLRR